MNLAVLNVIGASKGMDIHYGVNTGGEKEGPAAAAVDDVKRMVAVFRIRLRFSSDPCTE